METKLGKSKILLKKMFKKKLNIFLYLILFIFFYSGNLLAQNHYLPPLKDGGKIIFIRHALAPGFGDPENFDIKNCENQRNLNKVGIEQSKRIGIFFKKNSIPIDVVYSSEWCRCKDTAKYAFKNFQTLKPLNSFYSENFRKNQDSQIKDLKKFIEKWDGNKNLVFVTHYVVILEMLNYAPSSGEIVISNKSLELISSLKIN
jgi:phosphohistidine phosphatase SixA